MAVITLTSDWRNSDYYIGAVKGKIVSRKLSANIIDISHQVLPFNTMQAAFIIRNCYKYFPVGTVHIIAVNTLLSVKRPLLVVEKAGQFFICSDSGFAGLIFPEEDFDVYKVDIGDNVSGTFNSLDIYADVAVKLANGEKPGSFARISSDYLVQMPILPAIDTNLINGSIVYIDSYQNAITNINKETFERVGKGNPFRIFVQSNHYVIDKISKTYNTVPVGELVAVFNAEGLLEIALANGPVAELLDLKPNSAIRVKFLPGETDKKLQLSGE
ncbi:MAG: SAM-dependent chlorinase/fluorinase [Bacteroidales bacterium]|nr:SAM-dependent chlorinase/fluorinase [Bacteroidales bacterium]